MTGINRGIIIQDRDRHLLRELALMRVVNREQAACVARFGSKTRVNARLLALTRAGLLRRFFLGIIPTARTALYTQSKVGAQLVGVPYFGLRREADEAVVADFFVAHQLRINDVFCIVKYGPLPTADLRFAQWQSFPSPIDPGQALVPDGYLEVAAPEKTLAAFLEVDLGNENRAAWLKKIQAYLRYAVSGNFERQFARQQFRVLVVADSEKRVSWLRAATAELTEKIFWFTDFESVTRENFWSPIWQRPKDDRRQRLIETHP